MNASNEWGNFRVSSHDSGYDHDEGHTVYYELPWSQVDPFNDGFRRFDLTVKTGKANHGGKANPILRIDYSDGTFSRVNEPIVDAGTTINVSLTMENKKTPVSLRFGYKILINNYWGGRRSFR